jgi:S1-C subfamily serine protease
MSTADRAVRLGILAFLGAGAGLAAMRVQSMESRIDQIERVPRADPSEVARLAGELERVENRIASSLREIAELRRQGEHTTEIDGRLDQLQGALAGAASNLSEQRKRLEEWDGLRDQIGPKALDARMEEYRRGTEAQWQRVDEAARVAREMAESTLQGLGQIEKDMARDEDRMWAELVAPSVQILGEESVGSGVLFQSEPVPGTSEFRTYALTAWHVIRDLQTVPDDLSFTVPVTLYGEDRKTSPETATVVKYDPTVDVALLLLNTTARIECGAKLAPRSRLARVHIFDRVYAVGCPLGNEPIPTFGEIADTHHVVDGSSYWMISAPTYIGNSGGGIFDARTHELLGIFSKIYTHGTLRPTVIPHMGLVTSLGTIYDWLDRVGYAQLEGREEVAQAQTAAASR